MMLLERLIPKKETCKIWRCFFSLTTGQVLLRYSLHMMSLASLVQIHNSQRKAKQVREQQNATLEPGDDDVESKKFAKQKGCL